MNVILSKAFQKRAKKLVQQRPKLKTKIEECIFDFSHNVFESEYYRKKLKGYKHIHELELGGDMRILVEVLIVDNLIKFLNIGSHSQLNTTGSGKVKLS